MIIPVRCFTCGKVIADKWTEYIEWADKCLHSTTNILFHYLSIYIV